MKNRQLEWIVLDSKKNSFGDWLVTVKNIKTNVEEVYAAYEGEHEDQRRLLKAKFGLLV